ncbi:MAG: peptide chain release factor N(5)-glutamine methyltransferase [Candidatus Falkowbacteria bacterium]
MTLGQILINSVGKLNQRQITNPHLEAEILLSKILKKPREFILAHPEKQLTKLQITNYKLLIAKRTKGIPIAYLTGHKQFYGLDFLVNRNALIPRPETELMVEETLSLITRSSQPATLIDVGTGSGCIIITLAKQLQTSKFIAIDISKKALMVARQNAKMHQVNKKIKFIKSNLLARFIHNSSFTIHHSLIILANLPYLTPTQIKNSPSIKHEPKLALTAGSDGLKYYKQLFKQAKESQVASYGLRNIYILCEINPGQTAKMKQLIKRELPEASRQIKKDLSGLNRLAIISINTQSKL